MSIMVAPTATRRLRFRDPSPLAGVCPPLLLAAAPEPPPLVVVAVPLVSLVSLLMEVPLAPMPTAEARRLSSGAAAGEERRLPFDGEFRPVAAARLPKPCEPP